MMRVRHSLNLLDQKDFESCSGRSGAASAYCEESAD